MEIFSTRLWMNEAERMLKEMADPNNFYNRITTSKGKNMKVFHYNDIDLSIPTKHGEIHAPSTRKWWGNIYTNKASRTDSKFAWFFDPDGRRANCLTHSGFVWLAKAAKAEHVYPETISDRLVNDFITKIPVLTRFQAHRLLKCLTDGRNPYIESNKNAIGYAPKREDSWLHVLIKEKEGEGYENLCSDHI